MYLYHPRPAVAIGHRLDDEIADIMGAERAATAKKPPDFRSARTFGAARRCRLTSARSVP